MISKMAIILNNVEILIPLGRPRKDVISSIYHSVQYSQIKSTITSNIIYLFGTLSAVCLSTMCPSYSFPEYFYNMTMQRTASDSLGMDRDSPTPDRWKSLEKHFAMQSSHFLLKHKSFVGSGLHCSHVELCPCEQENRTTIYVKKTADYIHTSHIHGKHWNIKTAMSIKTLEKQIRTCTSNSQLELR